MRNSVYKIEEQNFFIFVDHNFCFARQFSVDEKSRHNLRKASENGIVFDTKFCQPFSVLPVVGLLIFGSLKKIMHKCIQVTSFMDIQVSNFLLSCEQMTWNIKASDQAPANNVAWL